MREYPFDIEDKVHIKEIYTYQGEIISIHSELSKVLFINPQGKYHHAFIPNELLEKVDA